MKKSIVLFFAILGCVSTSFAQSAVASPPETATGQINGATISINYGSPSVKGRAIWGALVPFDKVWRAGANAATTFETNKEITIQGAKLPAGKYSFFVIPNEKETTLIFSNLQNQRGSSNYTEKEDQLRVKVAPKAKNESTEKLLYSISTNSIVLSWEKWDLVFDVK